MYERNIFPFNIRTIHFNTAVFSVNHYLWPDFGKPTVYTQVKQLESLTLQPFEPNVFLWLLWYLRSFQADIQDYLSKVRLQVQWNTFNYFMCHLHGDGRLIFINPVTLTCTYKSGDWCMLITVIKLSRASVTIQCWIKVLVL